MNILFFNVSLLLPRFVPFLKDQGYAVVHTKTYEHTMLQLRLKTFDIIFLCSATKDIDECMQMLKSIRNHGIETPIIAILNKYQSHVYREFLLNGADFCIHEPINMSDIASMILAQTKRYRPLQPKVLSVADLTLNTTSKTVLRSGRPIKLKKKELLLLEYLLLHSDQVLSRSQLLSQVWDSTMSPASNVVDVHISSLRNKIDKEHTPKLIETVHGFGYKISSEVH